MTSLVIVRLAMLSLAVIPPFTPPLATDTSAQVFVATSPCDAVSRPLLNIPETAKCELIKWNLTLQHDPGTSAPTTYELNYAYGQPEQGTNEISQAGTKVELTGKWTVIKGTRANPSAVVYRLDADDPGKSISFQRVDHNLLHLLDRDKSLMVGNAGWSYTLSRSGNLRRPTQQASFPLTFRDKPSSWPVSALPVTTDSTVLGSFVGRSPCRELARELDKAVNAGCAKLKWDLTLYQNPHKSTPTTHKLKGTFYRERIGEGRWAVIKGTETNPDAVVYQLDLDHPRGSLFLLKADDNILFFLDSERKFMVGNAEFSYTLNRATELEAVKY